MHGMAVYRRMPPFAVRVSAGTITNQQPATRGSATLEKNPTDEPVRGTGPSESMAERRLDSWKEIAAYLSRDMTTVQRWEKREGMPVHRHVHDKRGSVYALSSEIDAWRESRKLSLEEGPREATAEAPTDSDTRLRVVTPTMRRWMVPITGVAVLAAVTFAYFITRIRTQNASPSKIKSLAVLPLQNLSGDPSQDYIADGMTEELIGRLSRIHGLKVISRTSSMHFKNTQLPVREIAKMLGVDAIVEGSLIREERKLRVHAQLIRAGTDEHIWAGEYQREYRGLLEVQDEITRGIVGQIEVKLTPEDRASLAWAHSVNPESYESYLKGLHYFNQRTEDALNKSISSFQQAIEEDSSYAPAYSGLAEAYAMLGFRGGLPSKEALTRAKTAALRAIELDDVLAEPHASLAFIAETYEWNWVTAEREYKRALELNPGDAQAHNWYAGFLTYVGRFDEGISEAKRARDLDPLSLPINNALAGRLLAAGRYDEALREVQETLELGPNFPAAHQTLGWIYLHTGKQEEAVREFQSAFKLSGAADTDLQLDLGFADAVSGKRYDAIQILGQLEKLQGQGLVPSGSIAILHGALGDSNEAFSWLEKAYKERDPQLTYIKVGRRFEPLRKDPRFGQFVRRIGLSD